MGWLWVIMAALIGWLGYTLVYVYRSIRRGREKPVGLVYLLMGKQEATAEWFIKNIYRCEGVQNGRLALMVESEEAEDDTVRIIEILSRSKGFTRVELGAGAEGYWDGYAIRWQFDVRGMDRVELLKKPLGILAAL